MSRRLAFVLASLLALPGTARAQTSILVVDMIPWSMSSETNQDSEPSITANLANPKQIAGTAFTADPMGSTHAPIFVSTDGGHTWYINPIVPGNAQSMVADITPRFSGSGNRLYVGSIASAFFNETKILRTDDFISPNLMTLLSSIDDDDQPWVAAATVIGPKAAGQDRVWVGNNLGSATDGHTAMIDTSLNAAAAVPAFTPRNLEVRGTQGRDRAPVRIASHADGTVYAVYYEVGGDELNEVTDAVVVRDDNWGAGAPPFSALKDPVDSKAGFRLAQNITVPLNQAPLLGSERLGGGGISIAVDPLNSSRVYVAYSDYPNGQKPMTVHVRRSDTRGKTWTGDLLKVQNAINPALAVTVQGTVGLLYQQLTAEKQWETHIQRSFYTQGAGWFDMILAKFADGTPISQGLPYLGDYAHLQAVGNEFFGVFASANYPDLAHLPMGFSFVRNVDLVNHTLLSTSGKSTVAISIDPFFFRLSSQNAGDDFWVRDWTDSPLSGDDGTEPSTHDIFYATSDVWNRTSNQPGAFPNDQPDAQAPGNGAGSAGDNWLFARIRRQYTSAIAQTVKAQFLAARFGIGSPFQFVSLYPSVDVTFAANEKGPKTTPPLAWHFNAAGSMKVSLAVEISSPRDPLGGSSLNGTSAGWPDADIRVVTDNNRAQRNAQLPLSIAGNGTVQKIYALLHNAATFPRDMTLQVALSDPRRLAGATARIAASSLGPLRPADPWRLAESTMLTIPDLQPGEDRWLEIDLPAMPGDDGEELSVTVQEIAADRILDGFAAGVRLAPAEKALADLLARHRALHTRLDALYASGDAEMEMKAAQDALDVALGTGRFGADEYSRFLGDNLRSMAAALDGLGRDLEGDPFGARASLDALTRLWDGGATTGELAAAHASYLEDADALLTLRQLAQGDSAAILQTVRWQRDLFTRAARLAALPEAEGIADASRSFHQSYQEGTVSNADYPAFLGGLLDPLRRVAGALETALPGLADREKSLEEAVAGGDPAAVQKAHRDLLALLQTLDS